MSTARLRFTTIPITSYYGWRILKVSGIRNLHKGVDTALGTEYAHGSMGDGKVVFAGRVPYYYPGTQIRNPDFERGLYVQVEHAPGIETSYHSLSKLNVKKGDVVKMNQIIGWAGKTAVGASGNHVHNGLWLDGQHVDPMKYLVPGQVVTVSTGDTASSGGTPIDNTEEDDMTPEQDAILKSMDARLKNVENALLVGGSALPDNGRAIAASIDGIVQVVDNINQTITAPVERTNASQPTLLPSDGKPVKLTQHQDNADTNSGVRILTARVGALEGIVSKLLASMNGDIEMTIDAAAIAEAAQKGASAALANLTLKAE